jgi:hypothetical protein
VRLMPEEQTKPRRLIRFGGDRKNSLRMPAVR